ncbi:3-hydroxyisobutyrate dehydrogenase [Halocatena halophila]|uniref:3-hydroxyisobutyrate dehydrogenase n=1 Tax=Halocatena halophila TaxID=2814576 RepID=UPI002ED395B7
MTTNEVLDPAAHTVDEIERRIEQGDFTIEELRSIRSAESETENRSTAIEAIDEELDALTAGPTEGPVNPNPTEDQESPDRSMIPSNGGGATRQGIVGVSLPSPYSVDAPETVKIRISESRGVAGEFFEEPGTHTIQYSMRLKRTLESPTNSVRLAETDPLHPNSSD